jgi:tRNA pseudouridine38-40 synthase
MFTYQILIEYDGTNFVGWQRQKNGISIQGSIEKVLKKLLKQKVILHGSGRTDSGVHANAQSAHFNSIHKIKDNDKFLNSINFFLNKKKISILNIKKRNKLFHSRYSAKMRIYKYIIINRKSPLSLDFNRAWYVRNILDLNLIKKASKLLIGTKDFSMFRSSSCGANSPIRTIKSIEIKKEKEKIIFFFKSKSFLQQQVRSMVGCLKYVGEKKWNLTKFRKYVNLKKRSNCAPPAPSCGLYLFKVLY